MTFLSDKIFFCHHSHHPCHQSCGSERICEKRFGPALWDGEGTLFLERRPAIWRPPVRAAAAPVRLGLKLRCFSAKTRSTWTTTARGASPVLSPRLPRHGRDRSRASFHRQRGTPAGGRFHLVPLTCAGARGSGGRARGVAVPASRGRHRRVGRRAGGVAMPRPSRGGASRPRAAARCSDPSPETTRPTSAREEAQKNSRVASSSTSLASPPQTARASR